MAEYQKSPNMVQQKLSVIPVDRNKPNNDSQKPSSKPTTGKEEVKNESVEKRPGGTDEKADDNSTASNQTHKATAKSHHYNDNDENESWQDESEDEQNTVSSDKTSKVTKKDENKVVLPKFTRYQMMILLDQGSGNEESILDTESSDKNPSQRILEFLGFKRIFTC